MIFSEEKWNNGKEIGQHIKVSSAFDFNVIRPALYDAFNLFIVPVLGKEMSDHLVDIYKESSEKEEDKTFLSLSQRANANLALWYGFNELNTVLSNHGTQQIEDETYKSLYKYQERDLRSTYRDKGFNALDDILAFLESNIVSFPDFQKTDTFQKMHSGIIPGTAVANQFLPINNSRLIFLRLQPHISFIEDTWLPGFIGETMLTHFLDELKKENPEEKYITLRKKLQPVIIHFAAARLILQTGSITDQGLYFSSVQSGNNNDERFTPADSATISYQADFFEKTAQEYLVVANRYIKDYFPEFFSGYTHHVFDRDNYHKKTFLA